jgi:ABC-2 type transport system permease protein
MKGFRALTLHELRLTLRRGESVLLSFIVPLVLLLITGFTTDDTDRVVPGFFALALLSSAFTGLAIATGFERKYMVLKRLGASPLPRITLILAKAAATMVIELLQIALLWAVAVWAFSFNPSVNWLGFVTVVVLGTVAFSGMGLLMAGRLRAEVTLAGANLIFFGFLAVGDFLIPVERLGSTVSAIAALLPAAPMGRLFRWAMGAAEFDLSSFVVLSIWAVLMPLLAARVFTWEEA